MELPFGVKNGSWVTSELSPFIPSTTDMRALRRHVRLVPERDITGLTLYERARQLRWPCSNSTPSPLLSKPTRNL
jgi:hypothetical protein